MDADKGWVIGIENSVATYRIPPYGSIILYASTKQVVKTRWEKARKRSPPVASDQWKAVLSIDQWNLKADSVEIKNDSLFDWRTNSRLKFSAAEGVYTSSFQWHDTATMHQPYYLDLGKVYYTAEVFVNGKAAGQTRFCAVHVGYYFAAATGRKHQSKCG